MELLFGFGNLISFCASIVILFAAILALRHVKGGGAMLMVIGAGLQLLVSLFWVANTISGMIGVSLVPNIIPPQVFGIVSILASGALFMWGLGAVLILLKVGVILKQHKLEREIQASQPGAV